MLKGKKILIGITGSIAAYKIPFLIRLLRKEGADVQVIMTPMARDFVTPLTLSTLTEKPVLTNFFDKAEGSWTSHVDLGLWADLFLLAPLSANTMAKIAGGVADNLLLTTILSARCPVYFAPAMDLDMYKHPSTSENINKLKSFGYHLIDPVEGELASGLKGVGRLEEPGVIFEILKDALTGSSVFAGNKILVTAGPTYEPVDPVRFIGNYSSGRMGIEIAMAFAEQGASVDLILGPSAIPVEHPLINVIPVTTAHEMYEQCILLFPQSEVTVMTAAVADFTPAKPAGKKIKKETLVKQIQLKPTADILKKLGELKEDNQVLVGFALETDDGKINAQLKLKNKNLDLIVLNSLIDEGAGFGHSTNKVTIFTRKNKRVEFQLKSKKEVAGDILNAIKEFV